MNIIQWSKIYFIVADYFNKSFKVIDYLQGKIISDIKGKHLDSVTCIKKIHHPLYGDCLLSCGNDNQIILWSI